MASCIQAAYNNVEEKEGWKAGHDLSHHWRNLCYGNTVLPITWQKWRRSCHNWQPKLALDLSTQEGWKAELAWGSWCKYLVQGYNAINRKQSLGLELRMLCPLDHEPNTPPNTTHIQFRLRYQLKITLSHFPRPSFGGLRLWENLFGMVPFELATYIQLPVERALR